MLRRWPTTVLVMALAAAAPLAAQDEAEADTLITVRGEVLDGVNGRPLIGVLVALHDVWMITRTDDLGYFEFEEVPVGPHELGVYGLGYETFEDFIEFVPDEILAVRLDVAPVELEGLEIEVFGREAIEYRSTGIRYDFIGPELMEEYRVKYGAIVDMIRARFPSVYVHQLGSSSNSFCLRSTRASSSPSEGNFGCAIMFIDGLPALSEDVARLHPEEIESIRYIPRLEARLMYGEDGRYGVLRVVTRTGRR